MFQFGGQRKDAKDTAKDVKRESRRAQRSMDREYRDMEREESKLQEDIKRCAAKGEHGSARRLAKELVRLRGAKERTIGMKSAVGAMASRATTMAASEKVAKSIGSAAKAMAMANAGINPAELHRTMQQFAAQSERMEMTEDMVGDMIDDFDGVEEGEVDECTSRVLAEVGLEISTKMGEAPPHGVTAAGQVPAPAPAAAARPEAETGQTSTRLHA